MRTSLAISSLVRLAIHNARQTSQLHKIPRKNSSEIGALIFLAEIANIRCSGAAVLNNPVPTMSKDNTIAPARLPRNTRVQFLSVSPTVVLPANVLTVKNILLPVNNSDPANTTKVSARPKDIPINIL
ncbi:hypothetical protein D3C77_610770 [compost metagenome]